MNPYFRRKKPLFVVLFLRKYYSSCIVGIGILVIFYVFCYSSVFSIQNISVQGIQNIPIQKIRSEVDNVLLSRKWLVLPMNNSIFLDTRIIYERLSKSFALDELKIEKKMPHSIIIIVKEKVPGFIYKNGNNAYVLDLHGVIAQAIALDVRHQSFPFVVDENQRNISIRDRVLSDEMIYAILYLQKKLPETLSQEINSFTIPKIICTDIQQIEQKPSISTEKGNVNALGALNKNNNINAIIIPVLLNIEQEIPCNYVGIMANLTVTMKAGWKIFFDAKEDIFSQITAMQLILVQSIKGTPKEYIDVRIPSRVFYK